MSSPEVLTVAVCLFSYAQLLDFAGPLDLLGFLDNTSREEPRRWKSLDPPPSKVLDFTYLAPTMESLRPTSGPAVVADITYESALESGKQFDVLFVPGGRGVRPNVIPASLLRFIRAQFGGARYVLSVCTGSWALAQAGVLDGRRATTNKFSFNKVVENTSKSIQWVPKARWVVDGNFWSASGVSAGIDMACGWLEHLIGPATTLRIRAIVEYTAHAQDDDEWAEFHGLVPKARAEV